MIQTAETRHAIEYVAEIGSIDNAQPWATYNQEDLLVASRRFGEVCVDAARNETIPDLSQIRMALRSIYENSLTLSFERDRAKLFDISTEWISKWNQPDALAHTQKALQEETANQIKNRLAFYGSRSSAAQDRIRGDLAELTLIGAINFLEDPRFVAVPAPPHHDQNPKRVNSYDIALVYFKEGKLTTQRVQVKFGCQNFCDNPLTRPDRVNVRGHYSEEIAIVSGHCDMGMSRDDLSFASALWRSVLDPGSISNDEFDYLFHVGDTLIENLTGDDLTQRLGLWSRRPGQKSVRKDYADQPPGISPRARRKSLRDKNNTSGKTHPRAHKGYRNKSGQKKHRRHVKPPRAEW